MKISQEALLKLSVIISLVGMLVLLYLSTFEPEITDISEIKNKTLGERVKISGEVKDIRELSNNFYVLTIKDNTGEIEVTLNSKISVNKTMEIIGKLSEYKNKLQVQAEKIEEAEDVEEEEE